MSWTLLKGSPGMSSHPRSITWILVSVGGLAVFLIFASWVLISYPVGAAVQGYFYGVGVDTAGKLDVSVSPINNATIDVHLNETLDPVDNNASSDPQSPTVSIGRSSDNNTEHTGTKSNSQVPFRESTSENLSKIKEVGDLETSDLAASESPEPMNLFGNRTDAVSHSMLADTTSQVNSTSATLVPAASSESVHDLEVKEGIYASNADGNSTIEEPVSVSSINKSSATSMTVNQTSLSSSGSTSTSVPALLDVPKNASYAGSADSGCDLYHGNWTYDPSGPLYTNNSCPVLTQMQNCQGNGRPDKDYENWRWKPFQCDLPRFDPKKFLQLMRGKTLAFIGDSVARNQMESLLCILWQVEVPKNRGNRNMQRYYFRSSSVMIVRIWSSWLVKQVSDPFDFAPAGVAKLHLDVPEEKLMEYMPTFDVVVLSSGHWFAKQSVYILNNEIVGGQLWWPDKSRPMKIDSTEAYAISVETILTALVTHPNYTGLMIVRSYSPDHYEGGAWNTGGSCTGKVRPLAAGELVENGHTNTMHEKQVTGFNRAIKKATNRSKLRLMDITEVFQYRHDGHPGPYRSPDPNKITKRGPDGRPPPQDCLHWCMPGPVDTWNELVLEIIRREYEGGSSP